MADALHAFVGFIPVAAVDQRVVGPQLGRASLRADELHEAAGIGIAVVAEG